MVLENIPQPFLLQIVYNHQIFNSVDEFLEAYHNGTLRRLPERPDQKDDVDWSARYRPDRPPRDLDHLPGPRQVSFAGLRFRVDRALQYVSWMGWGLYIGFDRDMGMSLWDIRFMNERLIYEVRETVFILYMIGFNRMCVDLPARGHGPIR
jgi:primary-amine oxidase